MRSTPIGKEDERRAEAEDYKRGCIEEEVQSGGGPGGGRECRPRAEKKRDMLSVSELVASRTGVGDVDDVG
jgi:hypothetical protein